MKSKNLTISYGISLVLGVIVYFFTYDLIISLIIAFLMFVLLNFYVLKKMNKVNKFRKSLSTFSHFANSLIMQITVTPNVTSAINEISSFLEEKERTILQNDELLVKEKLDSIEENYKFPLYQVFKEVIVLYDTQGGNIIDMSIQLLNQIDSYIKNVEVVALDNSKKLSEVLVLWLFGVGALFYIRSILYDYYIEIIKIQNFKFAVGLFFMLLLFSIFVLAKKYIEIDLGD